MKQVFVILFALAIIQFACQKEEEHSERFNMLIAPTWQSDSLLVNGQDASGPGQPLEKFKGEARFYEDGTGNFGNYTGTWKFNRDETQITLTSDSLVFPLSAGIELLTNDSLKVTTGYTDLTGYVMDIRMTFYAK